MSQEKCLQGPGVPLDCEFYGDDGLIDSALLVSPPAVLDEVVIERRTYVVQTRCFDLDACIIRVGVRLK